jgi:3-phosphoshikimate 1-carboxyvinyltransferase
MLICAAFADKQTRILCPETSDDIEATADCLTALGAKIQRTGAGYCVDPAKEIPTEAYLNCRESGSTLRFLLPVAGALGVKTTFEMEGRLSQRPLFPLWEEMERMGCRLSRPAKDTILCEGKLQNGTYAMDGNVSSQFITGLLLALPLIQGETNLEIRCTTQSKPYIDVTRHVLSQFQHGSPGQVAVEGDWSNAAFWLSANALGSNIQITGLHDHSVQGDQTVGFWLPELQQNVSVSAADIPDLIPILSVVAATNQGAVFTDIARLRFKESDRVAAIIDLITSLGGKVEVTEDTLTVYGTGLTGGTVCSFNDHRIAMSAAIAATACKEPVTILGAECVKKSYPRFWEEYARLGGNYEKQLR